MYTLVREITEKEAEIKPRAEYEQTQTQATVRCPSCSVQHTWEQIAPKNYLYMKQQSVIALTWALRQLVCK